MSTDVTESHQFRYDVSVLRWDYVRAIAGAVICLAPLVMIEVIPEMVYILGAIGAVFTVFGVRTSVRHMTTVELSRQGVRTIGPMGRAIQWEELNGMKLAFYSMKRRRSEDRMDFAASKGWMELKLEGAKGTIRLDSSLDGFDAVVDVACQAALARDLELNPITLANLDAMGFAPSASSLPDYHL